MGLKARLGMLVAIIALSVAAGVSQAQALGKRVALVIGNSAYAGVQPLRNPENDATALGELFEGLGFEVQVARDLTASSMRKTLQDFEEVVVGAEIAVVYFAGHGVEVGGINYLIPVDAELKRDTHVADEAIALDRLLDAMAGATRLRLVFLDACRNNPFLATMQSTTIGRSVSRGLAAVEPEDATLVSFAAQAGSTAADGANDHSPFAQALLDNLGTAGWELDRALREVNADVRRMTNGLQRPVYYGSLPPEPIFLIEEPEPEVSVADIPTQAPAPLPTTGGSNEAVVIAYNFAVQLNTREGYSAFIAAYDDPFFETLASNRLKELEVVAADQVADVAPPPAVEVPVPDAPAPAEFQLADLPLDELYWMTIKDSALRSDFEAYRRRFPEGRYAHAAFIRLISFGRPDTQRDIGGIPAAEARMVQVAQANCISFDVVQHALHKLGYPISQVSGVLDAASRAAIVEYQSRIEADPTGVLSAQQTLDVLFAAAVADEPFSQTALGVMLARGIAFERDYLVARSWLERAASQNLPHALANLALFYREGLGVRADEERARILLERAALLGLEEARRALTDLVPAAG